MAHPPGTSIHIVADLIKCERLDDPAHIEQVLHAAAQAAKANVVGIHLHHFGDGMGLTGVAMLAESHISIHTWPEAGIAAVDLFVCGVSADAEAGLATIVQMLDAKVGEKNVLHRLQR
jgi:S-adenosylmethionine decarboxylase